MRKYLYILSTVATLFVFSGNVFSQSHLDALRFSQYEFEGTARFTAMGGAFGALGGDFTSLSFNPAGIGVYRSSELTITPTISYNRVNSDYMGRQLKDNKTLFGLSNLGYVGTYLTGREDGLVSFNFGVGYNKSMNYHRNTSMQGNASDLSIMDALAYKANSNKAKYHPDLLDANNAFSIFGAGDWDVVMANYTGLIGWTQGNEGSFYGIPLDENDRVHQRRYSTQTGTNGEYVFTLGGNISNKFYFGATFGVQDLYYENVADYEEIADANNNPYTDRFNSLAYREHFYTTGTGYNGKFGVIYRPVSQVRIGAALHTPTYYYLTEEYMPSMRANYNDGYGNYAPDYPNVSDYRINTPLRVMGSFAYTFGKVGLLSIDYEYANYSGMRIKGRYDRWEFEEDNEDIKDFYRGTSNIRVGGEAWIANNFTVRAGFIYNQSPDVDFDLKKLTYSAGLGYKYENFFFDVAYALTTLNNYYFPYTDFMVTEKENRNRFMLTMGFRF